MTLTEHQYVALTLWGETRGEPLIGKIAVACVIRNRLSPRWPTYRAVCLAPWQFSCWRPEGGAANHAALMALADRVATGDEGPPVYRECLWIAEGLIDGRLRDITKGATHYYAPHAMRPRGKVPKWAVNQIPVAEVGSHVFYRL